MTGVTDEQRGRMQTAWEKSGIPPAYWPMRLPDLGPCGVAIRAYLQRPGDSGYKAGRKAGIGLYLHGRSVARQQALYVLAKELVVLQQQLLVLSLSKLLGRLERGAAAELGRLDRCDALCIAAFYEDRGEGRPVEYYAPAQLRLVEDFLSDRIGHMQCTYLSACKRLQEAEWWSKGFRDLLATCTTEYDFDHAR